MKIFLRYLSLTIVVLLATGALTTLAVREQFLKPQVYAEALVQAGVYPAISDILITKTAAYVESTAKQLVSDLSTQINPQRQIGARLEPVVVWYLNNLIEKQTNPLISQTATNLKIENTLQNATEKGVFYAVGWLAGAQPDPKFWAYIPEPDKLELVKSQGAVPFVVQQIKQDMGLADLPVCADAGQVTANLRSIATGKVDEVSCYSPEIKTALERAGQVLAPQIAKTQLAITLNAYLEKYQIKTLVNDVFAGLMNLSQFKQDLTAFRAGLARAQQQATQALWVSLLFLAIGLWLSKGRRLKTLFLTSLWVGSLMVVAGITYTVTVPRVVARVMPDTLISITDPAISSAQNERLAKAMETSVILVVKDWVTSIKFLGGSIILLSLLGLLIVHIVVKNNQKKTNKQSELWDELPAETLENQNRATKKKQAKQKSK